jgi:protein-L-isoaspartate(D-aspartate) O-methyltransferase
MLTEGAGSIVLIPPPRYKPPRHLPDDSMTLFDAARNHMVDSQLRPNKVTDDRVLGAFARIRRELFVPVHLRQVAYIDEDLPLGGGRYLMEPMVAARLLQAANVERGEPALIVGAGTGYEAAVVAVLARSVVALEENPEFARRARAALVEHAIATVSVVEGPLPEGCRPRAPYDVILFTGAVAEVPPEIVSQLAEGGRLLAVVKAEAAIGRATLTTRTGGVLARRIIFDAATPLLPGFLPKPAFVFC